MDYMDSGKYPTASQLTRRPQARSGGGARHHAQHGRHREHREAQHPGHNHSAYQHKALTLHMLESMQKQPIYCDMHQFETLSSQMRELSSPLATGG